MVVNIQYVCKSKEWLKYLEKGQKSKEKQRSQKVIKGEGGGGVCIGYLWVLGFVKVKERGSKDFLRFANVREKKDG